MSEVLDMIKNLQASITKASEKFDKTADDALKEAKASGELSQETKNTVDKALVELNSMREAQKTYLASVNEIKQELATMPLATAKKVALSAGQIVTASENVKALSSNIEGAKRISVPVQAALTSIDVPDGTIEHHRLPGIDTLPKQRLFIRDLIAPGKTQSPAIFWVQQTGFTNNAAVVPENTTKPYSEIKFSNKMTPVTTVAHMFKASKQILDDFAQLQSTIDAEMRYGLKYVEEQEILFGDGTDAHLHGIVPQASTFAPSFIPEKRTPIDDLRLAMLQAQLARLPASGHVLHFIDWAKIELQKDANGNYLLANPAGLIGPTLWALPVITTEIDSFVNKFLTGAFSTGAQIFDREETNVVISTENSDDFEKNMISIRCEERLALAVKRPEAFIYGTFEATP
ncbi:MAG: hypothetical protein [Caudoviricetes sp.]|nr:MAG: hypothetical protein [Caudoviricetes sp.]